MRQTVLSQRARQSPAQHRLHLHVLPYLSRYTETIMLRISSSPRRTLKALMINCRHAGRKAFQDLKHTSHDLLTFEQGSSSLPSVGLSFLQDGATALRVPCSLESKASIMYCLCLGPGTCYEQTSFSLGWLCCGFLYFHSKLYCAPTSGLLIRYHGTDWGCRDSSLALSQT